MGRKVRLTEATLKSIVSQLVAESLSQRHSESEAAGTWTYELDPASGAIYVDFLSAQGYDDSWVLEPGDEGYDQALAKLEQSSTQL
jgi:hypothetical protein